MTNVDFRSAFELTKYTSYLSLAGGYGVLSAYFGENMPCYNATGQYWLNTLYRNHRTL